MLCCKSGLILFILFLFILNNKLFSFFLFHKNKTKDRWFIQSLKNKNTPEIAIRRHSIMHIFNEHSLMATDFPLRMERFEGLEVLNDQDTTDMV